MFKRARIWLLIAVVAAGFGFTGMLRATAVIAQGAFYASAAFTILSLLFGLFEESKPAPAATESPQAKLIPLPDLEQPMQETARAA